MGVRHHELLHGLRISLGGVVVGSSIDLEEHFTGTMNHVVMVFHTPMERWRLYINESMMLDDLTIYGRALAEDDVHALFHHRN